MAAKKHSRKTHRKSPRKAHARKHKYHTSHAKSGAKHRPLDFLTGQLNHLASVVATRSPSGAIKDAAAHAARATKAFG
jgi:hypothetical protein